ncbi:hypothetical protein PAN31108_02446 [Pandoraea anhela]|uniref:Uncharacterized protein n=1 Tax=Pandoraea anhela TaxID=2508295 RepID=A0A5E4V793_9BURK|nr:hypothetical protein PAN31108_02446 [Pandoraea anhela]
MERRLTPGRAAGPGQKAAGAKGGWGSALREAVRHYVFSGQFECSRTAVPAEA